MSRPRKDVKFAHLNGRRPSRPAADSIDGMMEEKSPTKNGHTSKMERPDFDRNQSMDGGWTDDEKVRRS